MANIQLQRTVAKTAIDQKQSLEVVQTMLHGGLSTLAYMREFFREGVFQRHWYDAAEKIHPYADYAAGKLADSAKVATEPNTAIEVLRRGRSKRVDMLLDWLEVGAFPALKSGLLVALRVYVHPEPKDRTKVIEMYTFTIKYEDRVPTGLEMDSPGAAQVSVGASNKSLHVFFRQLIARCDELPSLPVQKFISMELFYKSKSEDTFRPRGFAPSQSDSFNFAELVGLETKHKTFPNLDSGFHSATLKITHLQHGAGHPSARRRIMPAQLQYTTASSKMADVGLSRGEGQPSRTSESANADKTAQSVAATSSTIVEDSAPAEDNKQTQFVDAEVTQISPAPTSDKAPLNNLPKAGANGRIGSKLRGPSFPPRGSSQAPFHSDASDVTQSSNIPGFKERMMQMGLPESLTQGDTQTPAMSQSQSQAAAPKQALLRNGKASTRPSLSEHRAGQLHEFQQRLRSTALKLAKSENGKQKAADIILCQCGSSKERGDMVCCKYCETWQHLSCYGFTGSNDPRLPEVHACYQCLLGDREVETLEKLSMLAEQRSAMQYAFENGMSTQRAFAAETGLPTSSFMPLQQIFKKEGYIVAAKGAHRSGHAAAGKPQYVAVKDGPNHEKLLKNLFDPMTNIGHHYDRPHKVTVSSAALTRQLLADQDDDMPPSVTPATRGKNVTQTPGTDLDQRASMTPFKTPSRAPTQKQRALKRDRELDDGDDRQPKRHSSVYSSMERLKSVNTHYMMDVGAISPTPIFVQDSDGPV